MLEQKGWDSEQLLPKILPSVAISFDHLLCYPLINLLIAPMLHRVHATNVRRDDSAMRSTMKNCEYELSSTVACVLLNSLISEGSVRGEKPKITAYTMIAMVLTSAPSV